MFKVYNVQSLFIVFVIFVFTQAWCILFPSTREFISYSGTMCTCCERYIDLLVFDVYIYLCNFFMVIIYIAVFVSACRMLPTLNA